jgi:hypothetical protein
MIIKNLNYKKIEVLKKYLLGKRVHTNSPLNRRELTYVVTTIEIDDRNMLLFMGVHYPTENHPFDVYTTKYMYQYVEDLMKGYFHLHMETDHMYYKINKDPRK